MDTTNVLPDHLVADEVRSFTRWTGLAPEGLGDIIKHYQDRSSPFHAAAAECLQRIVRNIKEYCVERGVTKYCHWFNSWTESPAYKRDDIRNLSPETLFQGEPDASSKPSGGLRSTYEARGYTVWDSKAPLFVLNGTTLCIPCLFISYNGDVLDLKSPLLRAKGALAKAVRRFFEVTAPGRYDWSAVKVRTFAGPEQEYFLLPASIVARRPDLVLCGATILGNPPPRSQQLEEHYLGSIRSDVNAFFEELNAELFRLGVRPAADHNEVAPRQFEFAPMHEEAVRAADCNLLVMHMLDEVASRHGWVAITHEKPFQGLNGSGKHLNFSIAVVDKVTNELIDNLYKPPTDPERRMAFLLMLASTAVAVKRRARLLRASVASRSNDLRLGGNEAPPAVMSVYLGETMQAAVRELFGLEPAVGAGAAATRIDLALEGIPLVARDHTDRNRTSPVAFTGNKFEFRMPGSNKAIFLPLTVLLAAVAEVLEELSQKIDDGLARRGRDVVLLDALTDLMREAEAVVYNGDCYSEAWREEAARRGLPHAPDTATALEAFADPAELQFLERMGIWSREIATAFYRARLDEYAKQVAIEAGTMLEMVQTGIRPALLEHQTGLAERTVALAETREIAARGANRAEADLAGHLSRSLEELRGFGNLLSELDEQAARVRTSLDELGKLGDEGVRGRHAAQSLAPALSALRRAVDQAERVLPRDLFPFPTCEELLYSDLANGGGRPSERATP